MSEFIFFLKKRLFITVLDIVPIEKLLNC